MENYNPYVTKMIEKIDNLCKANNIKTRSCPLWYELDARIQHIEDQKYAPLPILIYITNSFILHEFEEICKDWRFMPTEDRYSRACICPWLKMIDMDGPSIYKIENNVNIVNGKLDELNNAFEYLLQHCPNVDNKWAKEETTKADVKDIDPSEPSKESKEENVDQTSEYIQKLTLITFSNTTLEEKMCLLKKGKFADLIIRDAVGKEIGEDVLNIVKDILTSEDSARVKKLLLLEILDEIHPDMLHTENIIGMMNSL